jgi:hypothetical protein
MPKYVTMQGKTVDMEKLMRQHETVPAIGNMKVNARGDELGPGGKIIRKREEVVAEYYSSNPNSKLKTAQTPTATTSSPLAKSKKTNTEE